VTILVTGSAGMLGQAVLKRLASSWDLVGVDLADADLSQADQVARLLDETPCRRVLHCAAWTDVDGAETRREAAFAANTTATRYLAAACDARGLGLTLVSTDYVFAGEGSGGDPERGYREDDPRDPLNYYGQTKALAEEAVEAMAGPWQIVRTSWLFGDGRVNFPKTIRRLLKEGRELRVVQDQEGCPTGADDLADVLGWLVSSGARGIFHGTNTGQATWFEVAREVARLVGADPARITPCGSEEYPTAARRPRCSILSSRRLEEAGCPERPPWQEALGRYLSLLEEGRAAHP